MNGGGGTAPAPLDPAAPADAAPPGHRPDGDARARVLVVGGGPAGLMAAEVLCGAGVAVELCDAMPSVGRKFLLAGKGGLNLTHAEPFDAFAARYGERRAAVEPLLARFGPAEVRGWARGLGVDTIVGSSGRVFPADLKAAPLLRAWLQRLRGAGMRLHMRHRWRGFAEPSDGVDDGGGATGEATGEATGLRSADACAAAGATALPPIGRPAADRRPPPPLRFSTPHGERLLRADAVVLALGGASWPQLGSDGAWWPWLAARGVDLAPLVPSNCGFDAGRPAPDGSIQPGWTPLLRERFAGAPLKNVALSCASAAGSARPPFRQTGECVVTRSGVEGSLVYAASAWLRDAIAADGHAIARLDLLPGRTAGWVRAELAHPRGSRSLATHLKSRLGIDGVKAALLHELLPRDTFADVAALAAAVKALPLPLVAARPLAEAISSAGGVRFEALDARGLLVAGGLDGVFCAGEMLDWEAPTGGYLLTACLASGAAAGRGVLAWLRGASGTLPPA